MPEPDLGPVLSVVTQYGDDIAAYVRAETSARIDTLTLERDDALRVAADEKAAHDVTRKLLSDAVTQVAECKANHAPLLTKNQDLIGFQVFTDRGHYTNFPRIRDHLAQIGAKRARSFLGPATSQAQIDHMNALSDEFGIEWTLTVGQPRDVLTAAQKSELVDKRSRVKKVRRLCNWNEPNNAGRGSGDINTWVQTTVDHGAWLMDAFGATDRIGSFQLWAGTMTKHHADLDKIGPVAGDTFHDIVWHLYKPGEERLVDFETRYFRHFGQRPVVCSETGMSTAMNQVQGAEKMTPEQQAPYLKTHTGLYVARGYEVYVFELENGPNENTNREDGLGMFFNDGSPKPAVPMFRDLLLTA